MRFKTKIILICCISILFSSVVISGAVYGLVKNVSMDAAEGEGFQNAMTGFSMLEDKIATVYAGNSVVLDKKVLNYLLKQHNDEMTVCFWRTGNRIEEIFNSTVFEREDFEAFHYREIVDSEMNVAEMKWEDRHFFVFRWTGIDDCTFYKLMDITYVWERMRMLGLGMFLLTCVVTAVVCLILFAVLNRVLRPLQKLNTGARLIATGQYDQRIAVERKDEIGELSDNFNQMADAVQSHVKRLRDAEWRRTLFMGNLTHELKTPMTAISGYAKTLLTAKLPQEDREEALSYIYGESCRLERISRKLMDLLLLEENHQISLEEVSAERLFQNAEEACRRSLEEDGIFLECHGGDEVFLVDADLFTEVLINLLDNARKASKRGDRIVLSAAGNVIEVRDFGKGIPEAEREKILEPFYMIDKSRSRKSGGAGLGLAITAAILDRHSCRLQIESRVGEGTRMILQFV